MGGGAGGEAGPSEAGAEWGAGTERSSLPTTRANTARSGGRSTAAPGSARGRSAAPPSAGGSPPASPHGRGRPPGTAPRTRGGARALLASLRPEGRGDPSMRALEAEARGFGADGRGRFIYGSLAPGAYFGDTGSLLDPPRRRPASVRATSFVRLFWVPVPALKRLTAEFPALAAAARAMAEETKSSAARHRWRMVRGKHSSSSSAPRRALPWPPEPWPWTEAEELPESLPMELVQSALECAAPAPRLPHPPPPLPPRHPC